MRGRLGIGGLMLLSGASCTASPPPHPFAAFHQYAPASSAMAQLPLYSNRGSAYQDHAGPAYAIVSAPSVNDTGSERPPGFPKSGAPIQEGRSQVILPNGGEREVRSPASQD